jgi:hypothetical protein
VGLKKSAEMAEADLLPQVQAVMGKLDLFFSDAESAIGGRSPEADASGSRVSNPRPSNHGGQVARKPLKIKKTGGAIR